MTELYKELAKLKTKLRRGWLMREVTKERYESVAEHTFSCLVLATEIIQKENLTVDVGKTLKMIAFHDIGEAIAQDYTPLDKVSPEQKYQEEYSAIKEISYKSQMPELLSLWVEFEECETVEATFAKRIDKLDAVLQAEVYAEKGNLPNLPVEFYEHSKGVIGDFDKYVDDSTKNPNQEPV